MTKYNHVLPHVFSSQAEGWEFKSPLPLQSQFELERTKNFGDNYSDGLDKIDSNGMLDVPSGPGMGVDWNWDAIKRMKTGTKIF